MSEKNEAQPSRKAAQRARDKASGTKRVELRLSAEMAAKLEQACTIRGGSLGPYEIQEYLITLMEKDFESLALHLEQLAQAPCSYCGKVLPEGCGGSFRGEGACFKTREEKQLMLTELNLHTTKFKEA
ncbi:MAG: hypothetical protein ACRCUF_04425 [Aeromonas sobria]